MAKDISTEEVLREENSHGDLWNNMHGGYFSSPDIAAPYIAKIADVVDLYEPDAVVDLGGGTGFILDQLAQKVSAKDMELIDLELSEEQLDSITNKSITPRLGSISSFERSELGLNEKTTLFISRSTFHYAGLEGLKPLVSHIRGQMLTGEFFVHQTACFMTDKDAGILNLVYEMMGTDKGYPTMRELSEALETAGFEISDISQVQSLELTSESLMTRYNFDEKRAGEITESVIKQFGKEKEGVFHLTPTGFSTFLHYMVFTCTAV